MKQKVFILYPDAPQSHWLLNHQQSKGYEGSDNEERVEDVRLEGEERQTHVGEDKVLCQEVQQLKQLKGMRKADIEFHLYMLLPQFLHFLLFETVKNFQNILAHHMTNDDSGRPRVREKSFKKCLSHFLMKLHLMRLFCRGLPIKHVNHYTNRTCLSVTECSENQ